jgi:hypothetical protein
MYFCQFYNSGTYKKNRILRILFQNGIVMKINVDSDDSALIFRMKMMRF